MSAYRHVRPRFVAHAAALVRALALLLDKRDHSCTERRAAKEQPHANHTDTKPFAFSQYPRCGAGPLLEANGDCLQVAAANFATMGTF